MSASDVQKAWRACKGDADCQNALETLFVSQGGTITVDPAQPGGKVFTDQTGGKVFIKGA